MISEDIDRILDKICRAYLNEKSMKEMVSKVDEKNISYYKYAYISLDKADFRKKNMDFFCYCKAASEDKNFITEALLSYYFCAEYRSIMKNIMALNSVEIEKNLDAIIEASGISNEIYVDIPETINDSRMLNDYVLKKASSADKKSGVYKIHLKWASPDAIKFENNLSTATAEDIVHLKEYYKKNDSGIECVDARFEYNSDSRERNSGLFKLKMKGLDSGKEYSLILCRNDYLYIYPQTEIKENTLLVTVEQDGEIGFDGLHYWCIQEITE